MSVPPSDEREDRPYRAAAKELHPEPGDVAEVFGMRWRELDTISQRLRRMTKWRWDRFFAASSVLFLGGVAGGGFGFIPFWNATPPPTHVVKREYIAALVVTFAVAIICGVAALCIKSERDDSVGAIRDDLEALLKPYREIMERDERRQLRQDSHHPEGGWRTVPRGE